MAAVTAPCRAAARSLDTTRESGASRRPGRDRGLSRHDLEMHPSRTPAEQVSLSDCSFPGRGHGRADAWLPTSRLSHHPTNISFREFVMRVADWLSRINHRLSFANRTRLRRRRTNHLMPVTAEVSPLE